MKILVINAGSSSLKYQLIDMENESLLAKGLCERIGIDGRLTHKPQNGKPVYEADVPFPTHKEAIEAVLEKLTSKEYGVVETMAEIGAVGHRVLHGGIVLPARASAQPRQPHGHQGVPGGDARRAAGRRVRHLLRHVHDAGSVHLRHSV